MQAALARRTRFRKLARLGQPAALTVASIAVLFWLLVFSQGDSSPNTPLAEVSETPDILIEANPAELPRPTTIVRNNPSVLESVLVTNNMTDKSVVETISDDELFELLANSPISIVVARIDHRLVAVPLNTQTKLTIE